MQAEKSGNPYDFAEEYINEEKEVLTAEDAVAGAMDIIAESVSDDADYRKEIRAITFGHGIMVTKAATEEDSVYSMYYEFSEPVKAVADHRILAMDRGEKEDVLSVKIEVETEIITDYLYKQLLKKEGTQLSDLIKTATDELQKKFYDVSAKMYQAANPHGAGPDMNGAVPDMGGAQGGTYDGDYTVVDDDNK